MIFEEIRAKLEACFLYRFATARFTSTPHVYQTKQNWQNRIREPDTR